MAESNRTTVRVDTGYIDPRLVSQAGQDDSRKGLLNLEHGDVGE